MITVGIIVFALAAILLAIEFRITALRHDRRLLALEGKCIKCRGLGYILGAAPPLHGIIVGTERHSCPSCKDPRFRMSNCMCDGCSGGQEARASGSGTSSTGPRC